MTFVCSARLLRVIPAESDWLSGRRGGVRCLRRSCCTEVGAFRLIS